MIILDFEEEKRTVKTSEGNVKTGLSKQSQIPRDYKPRGEGAGQRPTEGARKGDGKGGGKEKGKGRGKGMK
jgi:hypothetical protein